MAGPNYGMPAFHKYTMADLRPTMPDPRCDPQFPLANYWPVYLGNFWCDVYPQHATRIQEYFGSKGLLVRMVFGRKPACDPYFYEQRRCNCYDFLVYFVSHQDAENAVYYCNREMYYGHRLNVLSGRTPEYFNISKSVKYTLIQPRRLEIAEQTFERYIYNICRARTRCILKHSDEVILVEYCSTDDRTMALTYCKIAVPELVSLNQVKQRFLERDVLRELMVCIQSNPAFINMQTPGSVLHALLNGYLPQNTMSWKTLSKVPSIQKIRVFGRGSKRKSSYQRVYIQAKKIFGVDVDKQNLFSEDVRELKKKRKHESRMERY